MIALGGLFMCGLYLAAAGGQGLYTGHYGECGCQIQGASDDARGVYVGAAALLVGSWLMVAMFVQLYSSAARCEAIPHACAARLRYGAIVSTVAACCVLAYLTVAVLNRIWDVECESKSVWAALYSAYNAAIIVLAPGCLLGALAPVAVCWVACWFLAAIWTRASDCVRPPAAGAIHAADV